MAAHYNLYEAKTKLSELVDKAAAGEEIVICKAGKPLAHLGPIPEKPKEQRVPGQWKEDIKLYEPADAPMPDEIVDAFYESDTDYLLQPQKKK